MVLIQLLVGLFAAQSASPQAPAGPAEEPTITRPEWLKRPSGRDIKAVLPAQALRRGVSGRARMKCLVSTEGTLQNCGVVAEEPAGLGFGAAALALAPQFRMKPQTVDGKPVAGGTVTIPVAFNMGSGSAVRVAPSSASVSPYVARPIFTTAPTRAEMIAAYPPALRASQASGQAELECRAALSGGLERCEILNEQPGRSGAGAAALGLAPKFRLEPPRRDDGSAARGAMVRVPVFFSPTLLQPGAQQITRPEWGGLPDASRVAELFPAAAKAAGVLRGDVTLSCTVQAGGAVAGCRVAREQPSGLGFGRAALALAPSFRMSAWTSDGRPVDGALVRIPVRYEE